MQCFPPEQFLFFLYDDLRVRPMEVMPQIYEFIGINSDFKPDVAI